MLTPPAEHCNGHFNMIKNTPKTARGTQTAYISHSFPQHTVYRPRYKDDYETDVVEFKFAFLLRTGTAAKDVKWFKKRFPGKAIEKDLGYGIWFWTAPNCQKDADRLSGLSLFHEADIETLIKYFCFKYGCFAEAKVYDENGE